MLCFVFAALVVLLDQFIKRWVLLVLPLHESANLIPGIVGLTHIHNSGAAFGILENQRWLLTGVAFILALSLIAILLRYDEGFLGTLGLSAVLGGAIGNLVDRLAYGYVIDIFDLKFVRFAIFNVADIFITLGSLTFVVYFILASIKPKNSVEPVFDNRPTEYARPERPPIEDEIGLYDLKYGDESVEQDNSGYDEPSDGDYSDARSLISEYMPQASYAFDDETDSFEDVFPTEIASALEVLDELERELMDLQVDQDVDDLLREYGFEDDDPEF